MSNIILKRFLIISILIIFPLIVFCQDEPNTPPGPPTPVCDINTDTPISGEATIDGLIDDWNLVDSFFDVLWRAGKEDGTKPVTAKLYMMYNYGTKIMSVLVINEPGHGTYEHPGNKPDDFWVKHSHGPGDTKLIDAHHGTDFAFLTNESGWEAKFYYEYCNCDYIRVHHLQACDDSEDSEISLGGGEECGGETSANYQAEVLIDCNQYDYGDLPDDYGTLKDNNGARHLILPTGNPIFGQCCDPDGDGCPCESADGDDLDGDDDHDGVLFQALSDVPFGPAKPGIVTTYYAKFQITVGSEGGFVNAWIDWDADMSFDDQDEYIVQDTWYAAGIHEIIVTTTVDDPRYNILFHRWRITNIAGDAITPVGTAQSGEVEDYRSEDLPLPVELTSFTVNANSQGVLCEWVTESEIENLGFLLERKAGGSWETISSYKSNSGLMGQGTTSSSTTYEFLDALVDANTTYTYRLGDVDFDGVVTYHAERTAKVEHAPNASIVQDFMVLPAYPNPFNPTTSIDYAIPENGLVNITIYDITGSQIKNLVNTEQIAGWHQVQWNGENDIGVQMSAGMYLVSINTGQNIKTMKLLFVK